MPRKKRTTSSSGRFLMGTKRGNAAVALAVETATGKQDLYTRLQRLVVSGMRDAARPDVVQRAEMRLESRLAQEVLEDNVLPAEKRIIGLATVARLRVGFSRSASGRIQAIRLSDEEEVVFVAPRRGGAAIREASAFLRGLIFEREYPTKERA